MGSDLCSAVWVQAITAEIECIPCFHRGKQPNSPLPHVMVRIGVASVVLAAWAATTNALFFYVVEGQQRCFIEEVPADTLVLSSYQNPDFKPYGDPGFTETVSWMRLRQYQRPLGNATAPPLCRVSGPW